MSEKILTSDEAVALSGTTDTPTGAVYPSASANNWAAAIYRWMRRALQALTLANALRVYEVDGNADAVGVRAGRAKLGSAVLVYAGADPAVDGMTDNDTTYVWLYSSGGTATIASAVDGTGWPAYPHVRLAEVTMVSGAITAILDRRGEGWHGGTVLEVYTNATRPAAGTAGRVIYNSDDAALNIDTGAAWTLADGTST